MTHESHFNGDTLTLTSPGREPVVLSQGQCATGCRSRSARQARRRMGGPACRGLFHLRRHLHGVPAQAVLWVCEWAEEAGPRRRRQACGRN